MEGKILSIVLPTYNRKDFLKLTLDSFSKQLERNQNNVSFIVCNNASNDGTDKFLEIYKCEHPYIDFINYQEHVEVGNSIRRANDSADGKYILMWGDDDIPADYLIDILLETINSNPDLGIIHFNRLVGYDNNVQYINNVSVLCPNIGVGKIKFNSINDFLQEHILDITFLSTLLFKREYWVQSHKLNLDTQKHYGYEFLGQILHGYKKEMIFYFQYPLCIQRKPYNRTWMNKSPFYRFVGIPNMYNDFEKWGIINSAHELWMKKGNTTREFFSIMAQTSVYKKDYIPIYKEMLSSQYNFFRKLMTLMFIFIFPGCIYKLIRKCVFK